MSNISVKIKTFVYEQLIKKHDDKYTVNEVVEKLSSDDEFSGRQMYRTEDIKEAIEIIKPLFDKNQNISAKEIYDSLRE